MLQGLRPSNPMAFWQNKEFKRLYLTWEEKLEQSGLDDVEEGSLDSRVLRQRASNVYRSAPEVVRWAKQSYFTLLAECAERHSFKSLIEQTIISFRCQGLKICEIASRLKDRGLDRHPKTIRSVIRHYECLWGIKHWQPNQIRPQPKKK